MKDAEEAMRRVLAGVGIVEGPDTSDTPGRFVEFLGEWSGTAVIPTVSTFPASGGGPIALRGLRFYSLCAHHLVPFFGTVDIAYRPNTAVIGLSGIARLVDHVARRPTLQERLVEGIAEALVAAAAPQGVCVRTRARHLCMEMRGARAVGEVEVWARRGSVDSELESATRG